MQQIKFKNTITFNYNYRKKEKKVNLKNVRL